MWKVARAHVRVLAKLVFALLKANQRKMIRDLDSTIEQLFKAGAVAGSSLSTASIDFDLPDATWRSGLTTPTVNCYLYDVRENLDMRTYEDIRTRNTASNTVTRVPAPIRIDCSYCITTWSTATTDAVLDEHDLLSQALVVLLDNQTIPSALLQGALAGQIPPYPTVIASQDGISKQHPQFWTALDQKLKPSLNYVITLAWLLDPAPAPTPTPFKSVVLTTGQQSAPAAPAAPAPAAGATITAVEP
ncbi:MAG TPA: DUF4255 domain-containing protein [Caulobacteraceae bacterium]|nr:DUF4255 domain-containing protein [Caulobacteraceae bacterium]